MNADIMVRSWNGLPNVLAAFGDFMTPQVEIGNPGVSFSNSIDTNT